MSKNCLSKNNLVSGLIFLILILGSIFLSGCTINIDSTIHRDGTVDLIIPISKVYLQDSNTTITVNSDAYNYADIVSDESKITYTFRNLPTNEFLRLFDSNNPAINSINMNNFYFEKNFKSSNYVYRFTINYFAPKNLSEDVNIDMHTYYFGEVMDTDGETSIDNVLFSFKSSQPISSKSIALKENFILGIFYDKYTHFIIVFLMIYILVFMIGNHFHANDQIYVRNSK